MAQRRRHLQPQRREPDDLWLRPAALPWAEAGDHGAAGGAGDDGAQVLKDRDLAGRLGRGGSERGESEPSHGIAPEAHASCYKLAAARRQDTGQQCVHVDGVRGALLTFCAYIMEGRSLCGVDFSPVGRYGLTQLRYCLVSAQVAQVMQLSSFLSTPYSRTALPF
eukprot:TRINITY_DN12560_c0_g1_i2.p1 TRINITY_DN12560_c0_g1~~TRINITY_DN12560_c0_g1_i2.p1  ORF type:complete len:165 (-),score=13.38 TRINITY_DN12560_c0_g1_i2:72-566(-)